MEIKSLIGTYIQKSRLFVYPMLGIRRGVSVTPVQTYLCWPNKYDITDNKLVCVYHLRDDEEFKLFEDQHLTGNKYFSSFFLLEDENKGGYVFDLSEHKRDIRRIIHGKYSKLSPDYKQTVLRFFKNHKSHHTRIYSYLYPSKYYNDYAKLLNIDVTTLKKVGELCSLPDLNKECLEEKVKNVNFNTI